MLDDSDAFHDRRVESRMASRAYLINYLLGNKPGRIQLTVVRNYLVNAAWRIDRDLVTMGLIPKGEEK